MIESVDQLPKICFNTPLLGPGMNIHRRVLVCGQRLQTRTAGTSLSAEDTAIPATSSSPESLQGPLLRLRPLRRHLVLSHSLFWLRGLCSPSCARCPNDP